MEGFVVHVACLLALIEREEGIDVDEQRFVESEVTVLNRERQILTLQHQLDVVRLDSQVLDLLERFLVAASTEVGEQLNDLYHVVLQ
jgi:hypothetical protein